jgi:hypothetical protein
MAREKGSLPITASTKRTIKNAAMLQKNLRLTSWRDFAQSA